MKARNRWGIAAAAALAFTRASAGGDGSANVTDPENVPSYEKSDDASKPTAPDPAKAARGGTGASDDGATPTDGGTGSSDGGSGRQARPGRGDAQSARGDAQVDAASDTTATSDGQ